MRYGWKPHQKAAFYVWKPTQRSSISTANKFKGKRCLTTTIAEHWQPQLECVKKLPTSQPVWSLKHATLRCCKRPRPSIWSVRILLSKQTNVCIGASLAFTENWMQKQRKAIVDASICWSYPAPALAKGSRRHWWLQRERSRLLECGMVSKQTDCAGLQTS